MIAADTARDFEVRADCHNRDDGEECSDCDVNFHLTLTNSVRRRHLLAARNTWFRFRRPTKRAGFRRLLPCG